MAILPRENTTYPLMTDCGDNKTSYMVSRNKMHYSYNTVAASLIYVYVTVTIFYKIFYSMKKLTFSLPTKNNMYYIYYNIKRSSLHQVNASFYIMCSLVKKSYQKGCGENNISYGYIIDLIKLKKILTFCVKIFIRVIIITLNVYSNNSSS